MAEVKGLCVMRNAMLKREGKEGCRKTNDFKTEQKSCCWAEKLPAHLNMPRRAHVDAKVTHSVVRDDAHSGTDWACSLQSRCTSKAV